MSDGVRVSGPKKGGVNTERKKLAKVGGGVLAPASVDAPSADVVAVEPAPTAPEAAADSVDENVKGRMEVRRLASCVDNAGGGEDGA